MRETVLITRASSGIGEAEAFLDLVTYQEVVDNDAPHEQ